MFKEARSMDKGSAVWRIIFALSAILFFTIAGVVAVKGMADLKKLLRYSKRNGPTSDGD